MAVVVAPPARVFDVLGVVAEVADVDGGVDAEEDAKDEGEPDDEVDADGDAGVDRPRRAAEEADEDGDEAPDEGAAELGELARFLATHPRTHRQREPPWLEGYEYSTTYRNQAEGQNCAVGQIANIGIDVQAQAVGDDGAGGR